MRLSLELSFLFHYRATHNDEMCNFYIMMFYDAGFGDVNPRCSEAHGSFKYPADSDVTLAEIEKMGSNYLHGKTSF